MQIRAIVFAAATTMTSWLALTACQSTEVPPLPSPPTAEEQGDQDGLFCGGFAGIPCPEGYECRDNPLDDCYPNKGGADCDGVCVEKVDCDAPDRQYVSTNHDTCTRILFKCASGSAPFSDECGCGCEPIPLAQPCGGNWCNADEYCCNSSCGLCAPKGGYCIQMYCDSKLAGSSLEEGGSSSRPASGP